MSSRWPGAVQELGLKIEWRTAFAQPGDRIAPAADIIALDVGCDLCPGVIDHHQSTPSGCSATSLVVRHPELAYLHLVGPWLGPTGAVARMAMANAREPWRPTIVLHHGPDFDAICATAVTRWIVERGEVPPWGAALAAYADAVDQGRERIAVAASEPTLYALVLAVAALHDDEYRSQREACLRAIGLPAGTGTNERSLQLGLHLIARWCEAGAKARSSDRLDVSGDSVPAVLLDVLRRDADKYARLCAEGAVRAAPGDACVLLPCAGGSDARHAVLCGSIPEYHACALNKHYLRSDGIAGVAMPLTVIRGWKNRGVEIGVEEDGPPGTMRSGSRHPLHHWIIAVDPTHAVGGQRLCLMGLGASLEFAEQHARKQLGIASSNRSGTARYPWFPGIGDPWYDGQGHAWSIVDSPNSGSVLTFEQVFEVLREPYWEPLVRSCRVRHSMGTADNRDSLSTGGPIRLGQLREAVRRGGATDQVAYVVVQAEFNEGWGREPIDAFRREVAGGESHEVALHGARAFVGPRGTLVMLDPGRLPSAALDSIVDETVNLLQALRETDRQLSELGGVLDEQSDASHRSEEMLCRELLRAHVVAVARYYRWRAELPQGLAGSCDWDVSVVAFAEELERTMRIAPQIDGVARLLERLVEDSERVQDSRLNRLVFFIGVFGVVEALAAARQAWSDLGSGSWDAYAAVLAVLLFVVSSIVMVASFLPLFARQMARVPVLGPMLFGEYLPAPGGRARGLARPDADKV